MKEILIVGTVVITVIAVAMAAVRYDETRPPHWEEVCVNGYNQTVMVPVMVGKSITLIPQNRYICTQYERQCSTGSHYRGTVKDCS